MFPSNVRMDWQWVLFALVIVAGNFLMIGYQIIDVSGITGHLISGQLSIAQDVKRPTLGLVIATVFQGIIAVTLSALVLTWYGRIVPVFAYDSSGYPVVWLIGILAASVPGFQCVALWDRLLVFDKHAYHFRAPTSFASNFAGMIQFVASIAFVVLPYVLDYAFFPILISAGLVTVINIVALILIYRGPRWREITHRTKEVEDARG